MSPCKKEHLVVKYTLTVHVEVFCILMTDRKSLPPSEMYGSLFVWLARETMY